MSETRLYLSLPGNAYGLLAGAPAHAFIRSLKVAALMFDHLMLDDGWWSGIAGERGTTSWRNPGPISEPIAAKWQTPRERAESRKHEWFLNMALSESPEKMHTVLRSPTTLSLRATFEPIRQALPHAYDWIEFDGYGLHPQDATNAKAMAKDDAGDPLLRARFPDGFTRKLITESAMHAMVLGARMGASVKMDSLHSSVLASRVARGEARPTLGSRALVTTIPDVRDLAWEEVDQARRLKGLSRLRAVLGEVEAAAYEATASGGDVDEAIWREFHREYAKATEGGGWGPHAASFAVGTASSLGTSLLVGPAGLAVGVAIGALWEVGSYGVGRLLQRDSWMAAAADLEARAKKPNSP